VDAVGADQHVCGDPHAVVEARLGAVAPVGNPDQPMPQMDALRRECRGNDRD
jgi:hypothetical protein